jgi:ankyrin repeat protein
MLAVDKNNVALVEALLAGGADVNAKDKNERTALIRAEQRSNWDIAKTLLARGARKDETKWP